LFTRQSYEILLRGPHNFGAILTSISDTLPVCHRNLVTETCPPFAIRSFLASSLFDSDVQQEASLGEFVEIDFD
jgi:hypothetical protein